MSQIENHRDEISRIETELMRHMMALGLDWHDEAAMTLLANECKVFGPGNVQAAYASHDQRLITKAELFGLVSVMIRTMENAATYMEEKFGKLLANTFTYDFLFCFRHAHHDPIA